MTHPIDVASIDREQFAVVEDPHGNDEVLIVTRRGKYSYHAHERLLRALLVLAGLMAAHRMEELGHVITGMDNQVAWGLPHVFAVTSGDPA